jgi:enoyl-CoA hydratase/carnithine racemase
MKLISLERQGHLLIARIDRPDSALNAVNAELHHDLGQLFRELKTESDGAGGDADRCGDSVLGRR